MKKCLFLTLFFAFYSNASDFHKILNDSPSLNDSVDFKGSEIIDSNNLIETPQKIDRVIYSPETWYSNLIKIPQRIDRVIYTPETLERLKKEELQNAKTKKRLANDKKFEQIDKKNNQIPSDSNINKRIKIKK